MKISEQWLREWVSPALTTDELVAQLTMAGLEIDSIESVAGDFHSVVVAEIVGIEQHPDADKLRVCQVSCGDGVVVQVVCGAVNARLGLKAPLAKVGAVLPGDMKIKEAKLRGLMSFGMLCGASELGMEDKLDGLLELPLDAPVGQDIRKYLALDDKLLEVDLTPNRGDCLSVFGLSRELGVLNKLDVNVVSIPVIKSVNDEIFSVQIHAPEYCPRYVGRVIKNVDLSKPTPAWMIEKLRRSGVRSIDAVVDITNYVLLELGQPMHAFDLGKLKGQINVRLSQEGEKLILLDDQELELKSNSLVIADAEKALALAGIMGGKDSGVSAQTKDILLESAFFEPEKLAGRARAYGLHTDSSHRFERGVDYAQQVRAIERATALILEIVGGESGPVNEVVAKNFDRAKTTKLTANKLKQVLGISIPQNTITEILKRLGMQVGISGDDWLCQIPSYRFDISIEADLIEEIARIYGYNNLPTRTLRVPVQFKPRQEAISSLNRVRHQLLALGYQEAITYSFIEPKLQAMFSNEVPISVTNPISADMSVMRTSLLPGLVAAMLHNVNRQQTRVRLFESGLQFHQNGTEILQTKHVAGLIYGSRENESWANNSQLVDFYDIKGDVESILTACGNSQVSFVKISGDTLQKTFHPGQSAIIQLNGQEIGIIGCVHPAIIKNLGITGSIFVFELSLDKMLKGNVPNFKSLSKFPQVRRDISVVIDQAIEAQSIVNLINLNAGDLLQNCTVFDIYSGKGIEENKKSIAVGITFQHLDRSLNDEEIQIIIDKIVYALQDSLGAVLRN